MRGTRWLILLAIVAVLSLSTIAFIRLQNSARKRTPAPPAAVSGDTSATAIDYQYAQSSGGFASVEVRAKTYRGITNTSIYELGGLELKLNLKDHKHYDLIKSAQARFDQSKSTMYADGAVEITLDVPLDGKPTHKLTSIETSGVTFDSKSGKATTDRPARFNFEQGDGEAVGAWYDPNTRDLHLVKNAVVHMSGKGANSKPMTVEGGEITYNEKNATVLIADWSKLMRAETTINAGPATVNLKHNRVDSIDTTKAQGLDKYPKRELHYSADVMHVSYDESGHVKQISGNGNAKMHEESEGAVTDLSSSKADLDFVQSESESLLRHVMASGNSQVISLPAPDDKGKRAETRVLKAEYIEVNMRDSGKEVDSVRTHAPGVLEFIPNAPDQHHRVLTGERMTIGYGPKNLIKDYQSVHATTLTDPAQNVKVKNPVQSKTVSNMLTATFDDHGQLATVKQWDHFTYEQGDRRGRADTAFLNQKDNKMDLETNARIWDASGSTDGDTIHLNQKTGDYDAVGHVATTRLPDQDPKKQQGGMLDGDEPIEGTAGHMTSANHNKLVHYETNAVVWQGGDRITADQIDIDRDKHTVFAQGHVVTQFLDEKNKDDQNEGDGKPAAPVSAKTGAPIVKVSTPPQKKPSHSPPPDPHAPIPVYTVVTSDKLVYSDDSRLAHYSGNVDLTRPGMHIKSAELNAYLNPRDTDADSRLNHAIGDGHVEITESGPNRQRVGRGEHGEYIIAENKVVLQGNLADLYDSIKQDESHGTQLTYFTDNDKLDIQGAPAKPVDSKLHRKPHAHPGNR